MEKEALIDIILNDIKEVHTLVNTFKGKDELNTAFINLTRTKIANINEELTLLEQLNDEKLPTTANESSLTSQAIDDTNSTDNSVIAESSKRFVQGESNFESHQASETNRVEAAIDIKPVKEEVVIEETPVPEQTAVQEKEEDNTPAAIEEVPAREEVLTSIAEKQVVVEAPESTENSTTTKPAGPSATKSSVLGEVINKEASSVNDKLSNNKTNVDDIKQIGKPVNDVRKAFGLNDRFYFQRELFNNNADLFNQTLEQINSMDSFDSALSFLQSNYNWASDNEASESFIKSIKRRFI
ncbi:prolipoprotein diacylglyceryl transferase [Carboxylicivirga marina]|uniref:Uncharacterized protein n=1 Tax=Carboxylicivirga marina TaxID=2800988 RepID=A0ABS1HK79_9BACT|nr:hypothetical protein [Carboxylicivirga marina]MBK3518065.1 hypothetical protein [Carboxylicivirga marina]